VLPGVLATDTPSLRLTLMNMILQTSLVLQVWCLPWKAPILNLVDALSMSLLVMLVNVALGYADNSGRFATEVLQSLGTVISVSMLMILGFMICLGISALFYRAALGSQGELRVFNLGRVQDPKTVFRTMMDVAVFLKEDGHSLEDKLVGDLGKLSVYDLRLVHTCMNILADELEMQVSEHSMKSGIKRIASSKRSHSRSSFGDSASDTRLASKTIATLEKDTNDPVSLDDEKTKTEEV